MKHLFGMSLGLSLALAGAGWAQEGPRLAWAWTEKEILSMLPYWEPSAPAQTWQLQALGPRPRRFWFRQAEAPGLWGPWKTQEWPDDGLWLAPAGPWEWAPDGDGRMFREAALWPASETPRGRPAYQNLVRHAAEDQTVQDWGLVQPGQRVIWRAALLRNDDRLEALGPQGRWRLEGALNPEGPWELLAEGPGPFLIPGAGRGWLGLRWLGPPVRLVLHRSRLFPPAWGLGLTWTRLDPALPWAQPALSQIRGQATPDLPRSFASAPGWLLLTDTEPAAETWKLWRLDPGEDPGLYLSFGTQTPALAFRPAQSGGFIHLDEQNAGPTGPTHIWVADQNTLWISPLPPIPPDFSIAPPARP